MRDVPRHAQKDTQGAALRKPRLGLGCCCSRHIPVRFLSPVFGDGLLLAALVRDVAFLNVPQAGADSAHTGPQREATGQPPRAIRGSNLESIFSEIPISQDAKPCKNAAKVDVTLATLRPSGT